ncbi:MAG TPA: DUF255 domain-containing protein [Planctomycetes bacterium]|nr:DUF255 domain-containing protein [Planctomycetota bacterium]
MESDLVRFLSWKFLPPRPLLAAFLVLLPCCQGAGRGERAPGPGGLPRSGAQTPPLLARALEKARKEGKLVLVEIYDPSCKYCRAMEEVFFQPAVRKVLGDFVWIKMGVRGNPLVRRFKLEMTPAFLVFRPDGKPMEDILEGFRSAPVLAAELEDFRRLFHGEEEVEIPMDRHPMAGHGCRIKEKR